MITHAEIAAAFEWSQGKEINTKRGPRILSKAEPTPAALTFWYAHRNDLVAAGVTLGNKWQATGQEFCWWQEVPKELTDQREASVALSRATDLDIDLPVPAGLTYLPYQRAGIAFAMAREGTLIGDEMGLGKTIQAIGTINASPKAIDILVICPCKLKLNWYRELRTWLVRDLSIGVADAKCFPTSQIVIVNYDVLHKWEERLCKRMWDIVIVDEAHYLKSPKARRTKAVLGYRPTKKEQEEGVLPSSGIPARKKICMTGTPILNRPIEIFSIISWLDRQTWNNWFKFASRYCGMARTRFGYDTSGSSNLDELQQKLRETIMVRRLKKDVLKDLPPKIRTIVRLEDENGMVDGILEAEKSFSQRLEDEKAELMARVELAAASENEIEYRAAVEALNSSMKMSFDAISRIRHETALQKLPLVREWITDTLEEVDKLIVLAYHRDVIDQLHKDLAPYGCLKIYGGMSAVESQQAVDRFQADPNHKVIIVSIPVAVGMTLTAASTVAAVELDWTPGQMSQAEDRAHRIGQHDMVNVYHLVLDGSIDCQMAETIVAKQDMIDKALDKIGAAREASKPVNPFEPKKAKETEIISLTQEQVVAIHNGVKMLAGGCNGAVTLDGSGFSKMDVMIGHSLADRAYLSPKQAVIGRRLVQKYHRQLPLALYEAATGVKSETKIRNGHAKPAIDRAYHSGGVSNLS